MSIKTIITHSPEETIELGARIAKHLDKGSFVALEGDLGSGKTMLTKGLAKGLGVQDHLYVNSPSFVIIKEYHGEVDLFHFDVYRLDERHFLDTLDHKRYFYGEGVTVVEWADKIRDELPGEYLEIIIAHAGKTERQFKLKAYGDKYSEVIKEL